MEPHLIDALAPGRMGVEFGFEVVGVLGGPQGRLRAVFRTLANEFGIAPLRVAAFNRAPQHGVAGVDVVVPELGSLVVGVDADHDVCCDDDPSIGRFDTHFPDSPSVRRVSAQLAR